jgi:hypothetical protein
MISFQSSFYRCVNSGIPFAFLIETQLHLRSDSIDYSFLGETASKSHPDDDRNPYRFPQAGLSMDHRLSLS